LRSEIPSGMCAKFRTVAASNNRDHPTRSLHYCLIAPHTNMFVLRAHPVRGESYNQRNITGEVATVCIIWRSSSWKKAALERRQQWMSIELKWHLIVIKRRNIGTGCYVLYNVLTPTRKAVDSSTNSNNKEHTDAAFIRSKAGA